MKKCLVVLFCFFVLSGIAQVEDEWTIFNTENGVEFFMKYADCYPKDIPSQEGVIIKIVNTNNFQVEVSWDLRIWYDEEEHTQNIRDEENHIVVSIPKKGIINGSCENPQGSLYIFKKFIIFSGGSEMTHFDFDSISVKKIR